VGTKGNLRADPAYEYAEGIKLNVTVNGKSRIRSFPKRDQFAAELTYFSDCIVRDREPEPSGLEGLADVRIIEAIYHSIRTRRTVPIQPIGAKKKPGQHQEIHLPAHGKPQIVHAHPASRDAA
jgi:glucose-fructose oxidoreductase